MSDTVVTQEGATPEPAPPPPKAVLTPAKAWKKRGQAIFEITVPSGMVVKCRRARFSQMIADEAITEDGFAEALEGDKLDQVQRMKKLLPLARRVVAHVVVEPLVLMKEPPAEDAPEDYILAEEIPDDDVISLFAWATSTANANMTIKEVES